MKLVLRRAREARGLLLAAAVAALVATALVTGLSEYNRQAIDAGQRAVLRAATAEERSILISAAGGRDAAEVAARDQAVRASFADGVGGVPASVAGARYGTGRELTGDLGPAAPTGDDPVFAELATLNDLSTRAELVDGSWPEPGGTPLRVTLPEKVAATLGLSVGDRVPLNDRRTEKASEVTVVGVWRPRDPADPYWQLAPGVGAGSAGSTTSYGPFVLAPEDFARTFPEGTSASWLVEPDLTALDPAELGSVKDAIAAVTAALPERAGLGSSAQSVTRADRLIDRLARADLVGRSALLTPLLLIVVLAGYALILVAALINEDRRGQNALLRARGAARRQLAGLAAREATLVVLPAALLAPPLATEALRYAEPAPGGLRLDIGLTPLTWAVAAAVAAGCLLAMLSPALRHGGTYVAEMATKSRPARSAVAQRVGLDLALVGLAVLAWSQLRQYSSPVAGANGRLGIDPLLAAAPTLGVLAGAVVALRLLPPATRFAERFVNRRPWTATMLGMWQAGRRPHAGPVLLLALAVGGSTLAWSLVTTWERSQVDQANHEVGADLRVVERDGAAPPDRAARLAGLPGVRQVLPGWRDDVRIGPDNEPATVVAVDAAAASQVVRLSGTLAEELPRAVFDRLARARPKPVGVALPSGAQRLAGTVRTPVERAYFQNDVLVNALFTTPDGLAWRVGLPPTPNTGEPVRFEVALPDTGGRELRFGGFEVVGGPLAGTVYGLSVTGLRTLGAAGAPQPVDLAAAGEWGASDGRGGAPAPVTVGNGVSPTVGGSVEVRYAAPRPADYFDEIFVRYAVVQTIPEQPVPALVTPQVLDALDLKVGDRTPLQLSGVSLPVQVVGVLDAVPATATPAAVLLDLPSAVDWLIRDRGTIRPQPEWWIAVNAGQHADAARAVVLPGLSVLDRRAVADTASRDPYWLGARTGLLAAALGSVLLALVGLAVDVWATARRRISELAVLHTLGATPSLLARALLAEQTFLAGIGVGVGLLVGAGVGATMAPLVILNRTAGRPVPPAAFELPWLAIGGTAAGLLLAALTFSAMVAVGIRGRMAAAQLRIGGDR